jgi:hypothetical protein
MNIHWFRILKIVYDDTYGSYWFETVMCSGGWFVNSPHIQDMIREKLLILESSEGESVASRGALSITFKGLWLYHQYKKISSDDYPPYV